MVGKKETSGINFANWLSITRMLLAPIFMWAIFSGYYITGLVLIFLAISTDFIDGHIARAWKMQTRLGKMLDPIADKVIIFFAVLALMLKFNFPIWVGLIIISRDLILFFGSMVFLYRNRKKTLVPNLLGKITTFIQMTTIVIYPLDTGEIVKVTAISLTVIFTLLSGFVYFVKGYKLLSRKPSIKINLPNKITITRILAIPVFIAIMLTDLPYTHILAAIVFIMLALTDALDGYMARKRRQITSFGKFIDPLADKLLISAALIFLIGKGVEPWIAFVIIAREFAVTGLRTVAMARNIELPAKMSGKVKTVAQVIAITAVFVKLPISTNLMAIAVIITIYSGIEYFWNSRHLLKELA